MQYSELACTTYVLDLYEEPYDPKRPLVNLDEKPKQLLGEKRMSIPMKPESPEKYDYEYVRNGTANIFVAVEFKAGKRVTQVTKRRTMKDFARFVKMLVDGYPDVEAIRLVTDNLNTHRERRSTGSLRGRRLIRSYISITFRN
jgi:hypothetical protein